MAEDTKWALIYRAPIFCDEIGLFLFQPRFSIRALLEIQYNDDLDLINELATTFEPHHLCYAKESFVLMAKQLRERVSILVGLIDKVGIMPIAVTAYISFAKAVKEGLLAFGGIEWLLVSFILLYLMAMRFISIAQWIEGVIEIYKQAIALQSNLKGGS